MMVMVTINGQVMVVVGSFCGKLCVLEVLVKVMVEDGVKVSAKRLNRSCLTSNMFLLIAFQSFNFYANKKLKL